jgi:hypothetical protein
LLRSCKRPAEEKAYLRFPPDIPGTLKRSLVARDGVAAPKFRLFARLEVWDGSRHTRPGCGNIAVDDEGSEINRRLTSGKESLRCGTLHCFQASHSFLVLLLCRRVSLILRMPHSQFAVLADHHPTEDNQERPGHQHGSRK